MPVVRRSPAVRLPGGGAACVILAVEAVGPGAGSAWHLATAVLDPDGRVYVHDRRTFDHRDPDRAAAQAAAAFARRARTVAAGHPAIPADDPWATALGDPVG